MGGAKSRRRRKSRKTGSSGPFDETIVMPEKTGNAPLLELPTDGLDLNTAHSPILDMPLEILNLIMQDCEPDHLVKLCLVSRALNAAVTPVLYDTIALRPNTGPLQQIPRLLQNFMRRPELCSHVKTIDIGNGRTGNLAFPMRHSPYFPIPLGLIDMSQAVNLIMQTGMSHRDCWVEHFKKGDTEAALTLLLSLLPNLTSLTIESCNSINMSFMTLAIQEAFSPGKAGDKGHTMFRNLKMVSFKTDDRSPRYVWPDMYKSTALSVFKACSPARPDWGNFAMLSLFYLPSLREISLSINSTDEHTSWSCGAPDLSRLDILEVDWVRENRLGAVLSTCLRLRKLAWIIRYNKDADAIHESRPIDRDQIVAALAVTSTTLVELTLSIRAASESLPWRTRKPRVGPVGSLRALRDFASIKTLTVPWFLLMGQDASSSWGLADVLPRNLEHLAIDDDGLDKLPRGAGFRMSEFTVYSHIRDWLRDWRNITPRLKSFSIALSRIKIGNWTLLIRHELEKLCERVGVVYHQDDGYYDDEDDDGRVCKIPPGWEW